MFKLNLTRSFLLICTMITVVSARPSDKLQAILNAEAHRLVQEAASSGDLSSGEIYRRFAEHVAEELAKQGDQAQAAAIVNALEASDDKEIPKQMFAWITHAFAREYYGKDILEATSRLIQYKTFATDVPNRKNPEFIKQKEYLRSLSQKLGLNFRDIDGYVQEIWIGAGQESTGFMVHSDVQPIDENAWQVDPWAGEVKNGALWGRGAIDDKGPLAAIMYGMRALLDSGLPLKNKLILLVGTDEESANEDVKNYLENNVPPSRTIVVDATFPVICAEKGWCGLWLKLPRTQSWQLPTDGFLVTDLQGGFSPSIVPGKATATVKPISGSVEDALAELKKQQSHFHDFRTGANLRLEPIDGSIHVTSSGRTVHSSVPETGHNALMDLLVFLERYVKPVENEILLMAKFGATYIGLDLHGHELGIAHHDEFMGDVTVAGDMFETSKDSVMFMFNFRVPKGIALSKIENALKTRLADFSSAHSVHFAEKWYLGEPLYKDPNDPFIQRLLDIYNGVTGENQRAQSMGGGTYAHRLPNAVVFGPTLAGDEYLGHQPNEHIKLTTLERNIEILTHTLVEFGF